MTSKKATQRSGFKTGEFIVYPAHGVGQILAIEEQEVAGCKLELFVINFVKDKMTLRVPTAKIVSVGMRKLAEPPMIKRAPHHRTFGELAHADGGDLRGRNAQGHLVLDEVDDE